MSRRPRARETLTLFYPADSDRALIPSRFLSAFLAPPDNPKKGAPLDRFLLVTGSCTASSEAGWLPKSTRMS